MLMCPIPLPTVSGLYLYTIWEQIADSVPLQLMNNSESRGYNLSKDNKTLFVQVLNSTDHRTFRCKMKIRLCSIMLCGLLDDIMGPLMELHVLGKIMEIRCMGGLYKVQFPS